MNDWIYALSLERLQVVSVACGAFVRGLSGRMVTEKVDQLVHAVPELDRIVDTASLQSRSVPRDAPFNYWKDKRSCEELCPELAELADLADQRIKSGSWDRRELAESWLAAYCQYEPDTEDLEAAVYFRSRGKLEPIDAEMIRKLWIKDLKFHLRLRDVEHLEQMSNGEVLRLGTEILYQPLSIISNEKLLEPFWCWHCDQEHFITATVFRAIEWFDVQGFDPWLESVVREMKAWAWADLVRSSATWTMFTWSRSDLLLRNIDRQAVDIVLYRLMTGGFGGAVPWRFRASEEDEDVRSDVEVVDVAASLIFVAHRLSRVQEHKSTLRNAADFILQHQLPTGAWPDLAHQGSGSVLTTACVIHALAMGRPQGWEKSCQRAAKWLWAEQTPYGCWYQRFGSTFATVLVLDAIDLANGSDEVTFNIRATMSGNTGATSEDRAVESASDASQAEPDPEFKPIGWFKQYTRIPPERLRKAATADRANKRVRTRKIDGVVFYSGYDARQYWPHDFH